MAQVRFVTKMAAAIIAMSTLAVTGCSIRNSGSSVNDMEGLDRVEIAGGQNASKYMRLFTSAMSAIGWVVPMPFTMQSESTEDAVDLRVGDVAVESVGKPQDSTL